MALNDETGMVMPVSPMNGGGFGGGLFGGDLSILVLFFLFMMMGGWGNNFGGGFGGGDVMLFSPFWIPLMLSFSIWF